MKIYNLEYIKVNIRNRMRGEGYFHFWGGEEESRGETGCVNDLNTRGFPFVEEKRFLPYILSPKMRNLIK